MPQKIKVDMNPSRRRKLGYAFRILREMINGDDTGYTLVKAGVVIASVIVASVVVATFAPYILLGGAVLTALYVGVAVKDEYDRNKAEDAKLEQIRNFDADIEAYSDQLSENLKEKDKNYQEMLKDDYVSNELLLKFTLRDYLRNLELQNDDDFTKVNAKRKRDGKLPNQNAMIDLIEQVTGFSRLDPQFGAKVRKFLNLKTEDEKLTKFPPNFGQNVVAVLGLDDSGEDVDISKKVEQKNPYVRMATKVVKHGMFGYWKANQAMGLLVGPAILLGLIVVGAPVTWPLIVGAAVLGVISAVAAVVYNRYTEKGYRKNDEAIDESLKEKKTKLSLLHRLHKVNSKEYANRSVYKASEDSTYQMRSALLDHPINDKEAKEEEEKRPLLNSNSPQKSELEEPKPDPVSTGTKARMVINTIAQSIFGLSIGVLVGIAIASVAVVLLATVLPPIGIPLLVVTGAGLGLGLIYGARVSYMFGKASYKAAKKEAETIRKVDALKDKYENIVGPEKAKTMAVGLERSKSELLSEAIQKHLEYIAGIDKILQSTPDKKSQEKLRDKKAFAHEKILSLIEQTTELKRERDPVSREVYKLGDDKFYNQLAELLQDNNKHTEPYETLVQKLKNAVHGENATPVKITKQTTGEKVKNAFSSGAVNNFLKNNVTGGVLAVLSIALPLGFLLFGPAALPFVAATVAVVATAYIVSRVCSWRAQKSLAKAAETEQKLPIIERIVKLEENCKNNPAPVDAPTVKMDADYEEPLYCRKVAEKQRRVVPSIFTANSANVAKYHSNDQTPKAPRKSIEDVVEIVKRNPIVPKQSDSLSEININVKPSKKSVTIEIPSSSKEGFDPSFLANLSKIIPDNTSRKSSETVLAFPKDLVESQQQQPKDQNVQVDLDSQQMQNV